MLLMIILDSVDNLQTKGNFQLLQMLVRLTNNRIAA